MARIHGFALLLIRLDPWASELNILSINFLFYNMREFQKTISYILYASLEHKNV